MSICAIIPAASLQAANDALEAAGYGPQNFSVVCYNGVNPSHAALHAWASDTAFVSALKALPGVVFDDSEGDPVARTQTLIQAQGAAWSAQAAEYGGKLKAGNLYRYTDETIWSCIQPYDTAVYSEHPSRYPAMITQVREPGKRLPWVQPLSTNPYKLKNPFTGKPDECTHNGMDWRTLVDNNVWEPGAQGSERLWEQIGAGQAPQPPEWPEWKPWDGNNASLYQIGDKVSHKGSKWISTSPNNHWEPGVYGWERQQ